MLLINLTRPFQKIIIAALLIIALIPSTAKAGETDIVLFTGLRGGGEFEDIDTGDELKLKETQTFGIVIDKQMKNGKRYEFYYSHQPSELTSSDPSTGALFDVDIDYLHFGGKHYINKEDGTFIVGTIGATHFSPKTAGLSDETKFSLGFGGGIEFMGTKNIGLRLEGRVFGNFLDSSGAIFCGGSSGGCTIITTSSVLWQLELNVGLIIRF
jgi:opacity protein-like surface antigen